MIDGFKHTGLEIIDEEEGERLEDLQVRRARGKGTQSNKRSTGRPGSSSHLTAIANSAQGRGRNELFDHTLIENVLPRAPTEHLAN